MCDMKHKHWKTHQVLFIIIWIEIKNVRKYKDIKEPPQEIDCV